MLMKARAFLVGGTLLAAGLWLLTAGTGSADDKTLKAAQDAVAKVADLLAKNDEAGAKAAAAEARKAYDLDDIMSVFKARGKKGVGVGPTPGAIKPDHIESYFQNMEKRPPAQKDASAVERAANLSAAVALIVVDKCPVEKKEKDKDPKEWKQWSEDMRKSSLELAQALKAYKAADIKAAAKKVNESCINCHGPFRQ